MTQTVKSLTPVGQAVLEALAKYWYLTTNQMLALGVARDRGHLGKVLASLLSISKTTDDTSRRAKEIGELDFGTLVGKGRLPRMYYLTPKGAELVGMIHPDLAPIPYPVRVTKFSNDYSHRVRSVDFHIMVNAWAERNAQRIDWWQNYFDFSANSFPATRFRVGKRNIVPDISFMLHDQAQTERLFVVEVANGMDTSRVTRQLKNYCKALQDGAINTHYDYGNNAVRILFVFEHRRLMELVQKRADTDPWVSEFLPHFFFQPVDTLTAGTWNKGWHRPALNGPTLSLF